MINSQIPYNLLPKIEEYKLELNHEVYLQLIDTHKELSLLKGFMDGFGLDKLSDALSILHLSEIRASFELDEYNISLIHLYELIVTSRVKNNDAANGIWQFYEQFHKYNRLNINALTPSYFLKKKEDAIREKKDSIYKSFNTNLTIYTAPVGAMIIQNLCANFEKFNTEIKSSNDLRKCVLMSHQIRAISPYYTLNGHVSRVLINLYLKQNALIHDYIPLSITLLSQKEKYQMYLREVQLNGNLSSYYRFVLEHLSASAKYMMQYLKRYLELKNRYKLILTKYSECDFPIGLSDVLFKSVFIRTSDLCTHLSCHRQTAYLYLKYMVKMGVLTERKIGREKLYLNKELFDVLLK
jgi:Fic family protein